MTRQERIERAFRQGAISEQERDAALLDANMRDARQTDPRPASEKIPELLDAQKRLEAELADHPLAGEAETDR